MKRIYIKPEIKELSLLPHVFMQASQTNSSMDGNGSPSGDVNDAPSDGTPSRWFSDDMWDDEE